MSPVLAARIPVWVAGALLLVAGPCRADCIDDAADYHRVHPYVLRAIAFQESRMRPAAVNRNADGSVDFGMMGINSVHLAELEFWHHVSSTARSLRKRVRSGLVLTPEDGQIRQYLAGCGGLSLGNARYRRSLCGAGQETPAVVGSPGRGLKRSREGLHFPVAGCFRTNKKGRPTMAA
jgi:hypothetical protein